MNSLFQSWYSLVAESAFGIIISDPVLIFGSGLKLLLTGFRINKTAFWVGAKEGRHLHLLLLRIKKGYKQTAMVLDSIPWENLYPERTREIATWRKQTRIPTRPPWPILMLDRLHWRQMFED